MNNTRYYRVEKDHDLEQYRVVVLKEGYNLIDRTYYLDTLEQAVSAVAIEMSADLKARTPQEYMSDFEQTQKDFDEHDCQPDSNGQCELCSRWQAMLMSEEEYENRKEAIIL